MTIEECMEEIIDKNFTSPDKFVFHYTNQAGYDGITRSNYFILNSHKFLNDKDPINREIIYASDLILEVLNINNVPSIVGKTYNNFISKGAVFYSASFSTIEKSQDLHKDYGEYCLKIPIKIFETFCNQKKFIEFRNVIYDEIKQKDILSNLINVRNKYKNDLDANNVLATYLVSITPLFKCNHNKYQSECRIIELEAFNPDLTLATPCAIKKITFNIDEILVIKNKI